MKVYLSFNLATENESFRDAINGTKYRSILRAIDMHLRGKLKHGKMEYPASSELEAVHSLLWQELQDGGLDIYE